MLLRKDYITKEQVKEFFPMLLTDNEEYKYFIEIVALKIQGRKTFLGLHISAAREKESDGMVWRELFMNAPCIRESLDKPMREGQRELIYKEAKIKLTKKAYLINLCDAHPYVRTLEAM